MVINELTDFSKEKNYSRVTDWLEEHDLPFIKKQKGRIERDKGMECLIEKKYQKFKRCFVYALFYKNGYYKQKGPVLTSEFVRY